MILVSNLIEIHTSYP